MASEAEIRERLAEYLELPAGTLNSVLESYLPHRTAVLNRFPFLLTMYGVVEADNEAESLLMIFEAALFDVFWVDRYRADKSMVDACRGKLGTWLQMLADEKKRYVHDPNLAAWCVMNTLAVEVTARGGLKGLFGSRDRDMLIRVLTDCNEHWEAGRGLPQDLGARLRALEGQGVMLPSDIYVAIERAAAPPRTVPT